MVSVAPAIVLLTLEGWNAFGSIRIRCTIVTIPFLQEKSFVGYGHRSRQR
jgi:hypothetical protein